MTEIAKKTLLILLMLMLAGCGKRGVQSVPVETSDANPSRAVSATQPPVAPAQFDVKVWPGGRREISWKDDMAGDYNLDLTIDGKDLFLLAVHFNEESNFNGHTATEEGNDAIDGNRDGELNGLDLFLISSRFDTSISGYRLFTSMTIDGPYDTQFGDDIPLSEDYPFGEYLVEQPDNLIAPLYFKIAAIDNTGEPGTMHDYRPQQRAVWLERTDSMGYPAIAAIDGSEKRWLIPREEFETIEQWKEYCGSYWAYQATNGSIILCCCPGGLIIYETATNEYRFEEFPEGIGAGSSGGQLKLSGDGSRYFIGGEDPDDPEAIRYYWFNTTDEESGLLPSSFPPGVGNDPNLYLYSIDDPDSEDPLDIILTLENIAEGSRQELIPTRLVLTGWTGEAYWVGMKLSGDCRKAVFVTVPEPVFEIPSIWLLDLATLDLMLIYGPVEDGFIEQTDVNWDGSQVTFLNERGLFDGTFYTATISGSNVDYETFELGTTLAPSVEPTPDLEKALFFQYPTVGEKGLVLDLRSSTGQSLQLIKSIDQEDYILSTPPSMMGN